MYDKLPIVRYVTPQGFKDVADITTTFKVYQRVIDEGSYPLNVTVPEGDRPEVFADRIYGRSKLNWLVLNMNNLVNPYYDWVLGPVAFDNFINEKYPGYTLFLTDVSGIKPFEGSFRVNDLIFVTGRTLASEQPSAATELQNARVVEYDPSYCRLVVEFTQKSAWVPAEGQYIAGPNVGKDGNTAYYVAQIGKAIESPYAAHHFENSDGELLNPTLPVSLHNKFLTVDDFGYTFGNTPLGRYILQDYGSYTVTNRDYEIEQNDAKRNIAVISKPYVVNIEKDIEALLRNG